LIAANVADDRLSALYRKYGPVVYWRCLKILRNEAAAEDAAQETFLRVCRNLETAPDADEAARWIWRIATNYCLSEVRNQKQRPEARETIPEIPAGRPLEDVLADRDMVARIIGRVDQKLRAVAFAHYVDGLEHVETARRLGLSRRTVANRLAAFNDRARKIAGREA
jgi:RNA polymerase sigma-70 factor, ECF subfamily